MSDEKRLERLGLSHLAGKPAELLAETQRQIAEMDAKAAKLLMQRKASGQTPRRTPRPA